MTNVGWCAWAVLLIYATTNGVNLSDGLDGLAAGSATLAFSCLMAIGFWAFRHPETYHVNHALDLAGHGRGDGRRVRRASSGGTPRPPGSSWATPARSRSAPGCRASPSR